MAITCRKVLALSEVHGLGYEHEGEVRGGVI